MTKKNGDFENGYVTVLDTSECTYSQERCYRFQSLLRFHVYGQKNISKKATCRRGFIFLKKEKKISIFKPEGALSRAFKLGVASEIFSLSRVARCSLQEKLLGT